MATLAKRLIAALIKGETTSSLLSFGGIDHLFKEHELPLYEFVKDFAKEYGKLPSPETVYNHLKEELPDAEEPAKYYRDMLEQRYVEHSLKATAKEMMEKLAPDVQDIDGALELTAAMVMRVMQKQQSHVIHDFRDAYDIVIPSYKAKVLNEDDGLINFGWPTLDSMLGGVGVGDLISLVGRPAQGKTWFLLYAALHAWHVQKKPTMFVSMEMAPLPIMNRLSAMYSHVPMGKLNKGGLHTKHFNKLKAHLLELKGFDVPFWVIDGNLNAMVEDIWALARTLKPGALWIDGGYLLKHPKERDRFKRVAENADLTKQELASQCPTTVSWQFAKTAGKKDKKKGEKPTMDDIGYTDAIAQVSSLIMATLQPDSVETLMQREIDILKGRNGEVGKFSTHWNFDTMDFSEVIEQDVSELQFV